MCIALEEKWSLKFPKNIDWNTDLENCLFLPGDIKYPSCLIIGLSLTSENTSLNPTDSFPLYEKSKLSTSSNSFIPPSCPLEAPRGCECQCLSVYKSGLSLTVSGFTKYK